MEKWLWIEGYEGRYKISNKGRIKSFVTNKNGVEIASDRINNSGYRHVSLRRDGKSREFLVARLVAYHFIGKPENEDDTVNHIDGNKVNDTVGNLEWLCRSGQMHHAYSLGLKKPRKFKPKIDKKTAELIKSIYSKGRHGRSANALSKTYNVSDRVIMKIVNEIPPYDYKNV